MVPERQLTAPLHATLPAELTTGDWDRLVLPVWLLHSGVLLSGRGLGWTLDGIKQWFWRTGSTQSPFQYSKTFALVNLTTSTWLMYSAAASANQSFGHALAPEPLPKPPTFTSSAPEVPKAKASRPGYWTKRPAPASAVAATPPSVSLPESQASQLSPRLTWEEQAFGACISLHLLIRGYIFTKYHACELLSGIEPKPANATLKSLLQTADAVVDREAKSLFRPATNPGFARSSITAAAGLGIVSLALYMGKPENRVPVAGVVRSTVNSMASVLGYSASTPQ